MPLTTLTGKMISYSNSKKKLTLFHDVLGLEERASIFIPPVDCCENPLYYPIDFVVVGDFNYYDLYEKAHDITHMLEEEYQ